jgi:hypothetical protein
MTADLPPGWTFGSRRVGRDQPPTLDRRLQDGPGGCRVVAVRVGDGWRFVAWGPVVAPDWSYREWSNGRAAHWSGREPAVHYARGQAMAERSACLGIFATATAARAVCAGAV